MERRRRILFVTGTRADFGKLKPLIRTVHNSNKYDYGIFVTGMHMLKRYGNTHLEVSKANFSNIYCFINQGLDDPMEVALGNTVLGLSNYLQENDYDLIVVHGDRIETLAAAIAGALRNILVAHVEGGEVSGTIDELIRHSASKLSHIHFVSNIKAQERLIQLGEREDSIFTIGSPNIDIMFSDQLPHIDEVKKRYEIIFDDYCVAILHPVTSEINQLTEHSKVYVESLLESKKNYVIICPNNDMGSSIIFDSLKTLHGNDRFRIFPSMQFEFYLSLLKHAMLIVGNSSSGIFEAPVFGIPTLNIGSRQHQRFSYISIVDLPFEKSKILDGINKEYGKKYQPTHHYGRGDSAIKFLEALNSNGIWDIPTQKIFIDRDV